MQCANPCSEQLVAHGGVAKFRLVCRFVAKLRLVCRFTYTVYIKKYYKRKYVLNALFVWTYDTYGRMNAR